jgi:hypothetical protein
MFFTRSKHLKAELAKAHERIAALKQDKAVLKSKLGTARQTLDQHKALGIPLHELGYNADGLSVWGKNLSFMTDERFMRAYDKGKRSGHKFTGGADDLHVEWRVHVALWAAEQARHLPGDFVECGVNTGILALAICDYLDFNASGKDFWLLDTYEGIPMEQMSADEVARGIPENNVQHYFDCFELVTQNFSPYPRAKIVRGMVPDTLSQVTTDAISYLSIDMNILKPEIAAIEHFWPKMVPGGLVVLDDYGWRGHEAQKEGFDTFAKRNSVSILNLPTGQGLMMKPAV